MKYGYNSMKARVIALRNAGKSVDEIEAATNIGAGQVRMMTRETDLSPTRAKAIVDARKAKKRKRIV